MAVAPDAEVERHRREDGGAEGAEGVGCGEGVPLPTGEGSGRGLRPLRGKFFVFELKKASFGVSLVLFFLQLINLN